MADTTIFANDEEAVLNAEDIGEVAVGVGDPVIWHISIGLKEYVPIQALTAGLH